MQGIDKSLGIFAYVYSILIQFVEDSVLPWTVFCLVAQSCLTPCNPKDYTVHGILQAREYWSGFPSAGDLPNPETELGFPTLQVDSLPLEPPGKPKDRTKASKEGSISKGHWEWSKSQVQDNWRENRSTREGSERKVVLTFWEMCMRPKHSHAIFSRGYGGLDRQRGEPEKSTA